MKIQTLILGFLLLYSSASSQTKIDDFVSIKIPGEVQQKDFDEDNASVKSFYSNSKTESYFVMRMVAISNGQEVNISTENSSNIDGIYKQFAGSQIKSMKKKGFLLLDSQKVKIRSYLAYKISYKTADSEKESAETLLISLNGVMYIFTYSKVNDYILQHKDNFFNSLKINSLAKQLSEDSETSKGFFSGYIYTTGFISSLVLILFGLYIKTTIHPNYVNFKKRWKMFVILGSLGIILKVFLYWLKS